MIPGVDLSQDQHLTKALEWFPSSGRISGEIPSLTNAKLCSKPQSMSSMDCSSESCLQAMVVNFHGIPGKPEVSTVAQEMSSEPWPSACHCRGIQASCLEWVSFFKMS